MAFRFLTICILAAGCASSGAPPISNAGGTAKDETEIWTGIGKQPDGESSEWSIEMRIRRDAAVGQRLGTIAYPSLGCSGELVREQDRDGALVATEKLLVNPDTVCEDAGTVVLRDAGEALEYRWYHATGVESASATLRRGPR